MGDCHINIMQGQNEKKIILDMFVLNCAGRIFTPWMSPIFKEFL